MEKTIKISERDVKFKTNGIALLIYKSQTGSNLIPDIIKLVDNDQLKQIEDGKQVKLDASRLDVSILYGICWTFAKIADDTIPPMLEWVAGFDTFPIIDVFKEIVPMIMECISCSAEVKNAMAAAGLMKTQKRSKRNKLFSWQRK